jgi:hypothetical protein
MLGQGELCCAAKTRVSHQRFCDAVSPFRLDNSEAALLNEDFPVSRWHFQNALLAALALKEQGSEAAPCSALLLMAGRPCMARGPTTNAASLASPSVADAMRLQDGSCDLVATLKLARVRASSLSITGMG